MRKHTLKRAVAVFATALVLITVLMTVSISATDTTDTCTISGVWKWNEDVQDYWSGKTYSVNFTSNGLQFSSIVLDTGYAIFYDDTFAYTGLWVDEYNGLDGSYQTIDFGLEPQTVSEEFYTWFKANATEISNDESKPVDIFKGFIKNIGLSVKNAFNGFVYDSANNVTAEFETLLCYGVVVVAITVIVIITKLIIKKRSI